MAPASVKNKMSLYFCSYQLTRYSLWQKLLKGYFVVFLLCLGPGLLPVNGDWLMECGNCHCMWISGKKTANCRNLSLNGVPEYLSSEVQALDLSQNHIFYLEENAFLTNQLQNLHKLIISNGTLKKISPLSFTQLQILVELDLSNNLLRELPPNVFDPLCKVRSLVLNGNQIRMIHQEVFHNLKYLHKIELKHNRLVSIDVQAFVDVPLLSHIYLDGNELALLRMESFRNLNKLTTLSVGQNPWNCTCDLQPFRDFVVKMNLYTPTTACHYPLQLRGLPWIEDQPVAFACRPKIVYPALGVSINTSKENVTLICRVNGPPNTIIAWDYKTQIYKTRLTSEKNLWKQHVYIDIMVEMPKRDQQLVHDVFVSRLTIVNAKKSDEGVYTCIAESPGGKDMVNISLVVQNALTPNPLMDTAFLTIVCTLVFWFLAMSILLSMMSCLIYRRFKKINPRQDLRLQPVSFLVYTDDISQRKGIAINRKVTSALVNDNNVQCEHPNSRSTDIESKKVTGACGFPNISAPNVELKLEEELKVNLVQDNDFQSKIKMEKDPTVEKLQVITANLTDELIQLSPPLKKEANYSRKIYNSNVQKYLKEKFGSIRKSKINDDPSNRHSVEATKVTA